MWAEKSFCSQKELFAYLVENKKDILDQKKAIVKRAEGGLSATYNTALAGITDAQKSAFVTKAKPLYHNDKEAGILKRTILANTYWWMDSHSDVHLGRGAEEENAIFSESIKGRENKVFPIDQHNWSLDGRMGKTLALYEAPISWRALGVGKTGMTEGLFADAEIHRSKNERRYEDYLNNEIDQHSVGMRYLDIQLAVNDEEEYPKEYAVFQKFLPKIGNRQAVEKQGYFFAVGKAMVMEYSAVIAGSNELTPTMGEGSPTKEEMAGATQKGLLEAINKLSTTLKNQ